MTVTEQMIEAGVAALGKFDPPIGSPPARAVVTAIYEAMERVKEPSKCFECAEPLIRACPRCNPALDPYRWLGDQRVGVSARDLPTPPEPGDE